jgi:hypothetical protein
MSPSEQQQTYRVIQWATGRVGLLALAGILAHPALEMARVHNPLTVPPLDTGAPRA